MKDKRDQEISVLKKLSGKIFSVKYVGYVFVAPFVISFLLFTLYPIISAIIMSFQEIRGPGDVTFVGMKNYVNLLNPHYFNALSVSFRYTFWTIFVLVPLPLFLAVLLNSRLTKGKNFFRSAYFIPALTSVIVAGMFFRYAFGEQASALANNLIGALGLGPVKWLQTKPTGMFSLVILCVWRWMGVNMLYFLAGLQSIGDELYEAASIDGANAFQKFIHITIPGLRPVIIYVVTISVYGGFSMFAETYTYWTSRSPGDIGLTLVSYIYSSGFNNNEFGFASAIGVTLLLIIFIVNVIQLTFFGFFKQEK